MRSWDSCLLLVLFKGETFAENELWVAGARSPRGRGGTFLARGRLWASRRQTDPEPVTSRRCPWDCHDLKQAQLEAGTAQ